MTEYILIYIAIINLAAFTLCFVDKRRAVRRKWRISENTLIFSAVLGGGVGLLLGMRAFRHKTRHKKFTVGVPCIIIVQFAAILFFWRDILTVSSY